MSLLTMMNVRGGYGDADILHGVSLGVDAGNIVVLIGPNGAGKSTAMKAVFGLLTVREGSITFDGTDITRKRPDQLVPLGMGFVPQEKNVFPSMTIRENLDMGAYTLKGDYSAQLDRAYELFPLLKERPGQLAGQLSGGQRQMVAIARALMLDPKLLLLDEPTAGLSPKFIDMIFDRVRAINAMGISILMVEQNARQALAIADRGYVLTVGQNKISDTGPNLLANKEVAELFLGG
ncbi:ABC transporter ATP-binding protein [Fodinicurvata sp. EGI_FJ10296]|uniref:ABC transporter ATP-binding protein n=1 Tax=Fodinicurvata sp. EGI_FJ10296 TaxID=3231908 RepID=UPI0034571F08